MAKYDIVVFDKSGQVIMHDQRKSKWTHNQMIAWLKRKYRGVWQRITVKNIP